MSKYARKEAKGVSVSESMYMYTRMGIHVIQTGIMYNERITFNMV